MLDHNSQSATVRGHVESINILFKFRNFDPPANLSDHTNMCTKIFVARKNRISALLGNKVPYLAKFIAPFSIKR